MKRSRGTPKFTPLVLTVGDQFESITLTLKKPQLLCAPTDENGDDPTAPGTSTATGPISTSSTSTVTPTTSSTSTTLYGSPSRAFIVDPGALLD